MYNMFGYAAAMKLLEQGKKVSRSKWSRKGMWLCMGVPSSDLANNIIRYNTYPCVCMRTSQYNKLMRWYASQGDMIANDWQLVE